MQCADMLQHSHVNDMHDGEIFYNFAVFVLVSFFYGLPEMRYWRVSLGANEMIHKEIFRKICSVLTCCHIAI